MGRFEAMGNDGVHTFSYEFDFDEAAKEWHFRVLTVPPPENRDFFEFTLKILDDTSVRQTSIEHHGSAYYAAKGIPAAVLPIAAANIEKTIVSSPTFGESSNVFRTPDATKIWNRLVEKELAIYDDKTGIFKLL